VVFSHAPDSLAGRVEVEVHGRVPSAKGGLNSQIFSGDFALHEHLNAFLGGAGSDLLCVVDEGAREEGLEVESGSPPIRVELGVGADGVDGLTGWPAFLEVAHENVPILQKAVLFRSFGSLNRVGQN